MKIQKAKSFKVKTAKTKSRKFASGELSLFETAFVIRMIRSTPVTPERLAVAEARASRAHEARSAKFLDKYRVKAVA